MDYLSIPVELCKYAIKEHKVNQLRLYVFLKSKCSGQIKLPKERIDNYCLELGYKSTKTFNNNLSWLIKHKWITVNTKSGNYRIKGFLELTNKLMFCSVKGAIFEPIDFSKFKAFVAGATITYFMIQKSRYNKKRPELLQWSSRKSHYKMPAFYSLPHTYLSKILNVSKSCAKKQRNLAIQHQFISSVHKFEPIEIASGEILNYLKYCDTNTNNLIGYKNHLKKQLNDILTSNIKLRTKNNFKRKLKNKWKKSTPLYNGYYK